MNKPQTAVCGTCKQKIRSVEMAWSKGDWRCIEPCDDPKTYEPPWYKEYLKTEHWKKFKERYRKSGRIRCCLICNKRPYEIHHRTYDRIGKEELDDVVPLCRAHHLKTHALVKKGASLWDAHEKLRRGVEQSGSSSAS